MLHMIIESGWIGFEAILEKLFIPGIGWRYWWNNWEEIGLRHLSSLTSYTTKRRHLEIFLMPFLLNNSKIFSFFFIIQHLHFNINLMLSFNFTSLYYCFSVMLNQIHMCIGNCGCFLAHMWTISNYRYIKIHIHIYAHMYINYMEKGQGCRDGAIDGY